MCDPLRESTLDDDDISSNSRRNCSSTRGCVAVRREEEVVRDDPQNSSSRTTTTTHPAAADGDMGDAVAGASSSSRQMCAAVFDPSLLATTTTRRSMGVSPRARAVGGLPRLEVAEWHAVGVWTAAEDCVICRTDLEDQCRYCVTERDGCHTVSMTRTRTEMGEEERRAMGAVDDGEAVHQRRGVRLEAWYPPEVMARQEAMGQDERFLSPSLGEQAKQFVCPVVRGACHHAFHIHCLQEWYEKSKICPLCGVSWNAVSILSTNLRVVDLDRYLTPSSSRKKEERGGTRK